jgi:outer membrane protein
MKKRTLALLITMTVIVSSTFSQTEKGNFLIGGSSQLNYSHTTNTYEYRYNYDTYGDPYFDFTKEVSKSNSFNIKPTIGYFVADKLALTFSFEYAYDKYSYLTTRTFEYKPGIIYYFGNSNIRPFLSAEAGFGKSKTTHYSGDSHLRQRGIDISGGTAIFLTKSVSFNPAISYARSISKLKEFEYKQTISSFSFQVGLTVYLQRQKSLNN